MKAFLATIVICAFSCSHTGHTEVAPLTPDGRVMIELGDVTDSEVQSVKAALAALAANKDVTTVYLRINSAGGSISAGLDLIQAFDHYPKKLMCVADTHAYSMGLTVLEACPIRLMTTRSTLMMHECAIRGVGGNEHELRNGAESCHAMTEAIIHIAAARMTLTEDQIRAKITGLQWWMDSTAALVAGAIDAVIDPSELPVLTPIAPPPSLSDLLNG